MSDDLGKEYIGISGLIGLYDGLAREYCRHGVSVNQECWRCDRDDYLLTGTVHGIEDDCGDN